MKFFTLRTCIWWVMVMSLCVLGLIVRTELSEQYAFGFDQVQMVINGKSIAQGDLKLLGPRAGPTQFFTGPLPYYLTAVGWWWSHSPYAQVLFVGMVFLATFWASTWVLTQYHLPRKTQFLALTLISVSPFLVALERNAWNPNLLFLASMCSLWPLLLRQTSAPARWWELSLVFVGGVLGYQAHLGGILLPLFVAVIVLSQTRYLWQHLTFQQLFGRSFSWIFVSTLGLGISVLPTILFDLRNEWLNAKGVWLFLTTPTTSVTEILPFPQRMLNILLIMWELTGRLWFDTNTITLCVLIGCLVWIGWWQCAHPQKRIGVLSVIFVTWLMLSAYRGGTPEYYFLLLGPIWVLQWAELGRVLWRRLQFLSQSYASLRGLAPVFAGITMACLFFYLAIINRLESKNVSGLRLGQHLAAAEYVRSLIREDGEHQLVYDMPPVEQFGLRFLLADIPTTSTAKRRIHLLMPREENDNLAKRFGPLGVWQTPVWQETAHYFRLRSIMIETPSDLQILESYDPGTFPSADRQLVMVWKNQAIGRLYVYEDQGLNPATKDFLSQLSEKHPGDWTAGTWNNQSFFIWNTAQVYFIATFTELPPSLTPGQVFSQLQLVK